MIADRNLMNTLSLSETDIRAFPHRTADRNLTTHCPLSETYKAAVSETVQSVLAPDCRRETHDTLPGFRDLQSSGL